MAEMTLNRISKEEIISALAREMNSKALLRSTIKNKRYQLMAAEFLQQIALVLSKEADKKIELECLPSEQTTTISEGSWVRIELKIFQDSLFLFMELDFIRKILKSRREAVNSSLDYNLDANTTSACADLTPQTDFSQESNFISLFVLQQLNSNLLFFGQRISLCGIELASSPPNKENSSLSLLMPELKDDFIPFSIKAKMGSHSFFCQALLAQALGRRILLHAQNKWHPALQKSCFPQVRLKYRLRVLWPASSIYSLLALKPGHFLAACPNSTGRKILLTLLPDWPSAAAYYNSPHPLLELVKGSAPGRLILRIIGTCKSKEQK